MLHYYIVSAAILQVLQLLRRILTVLRLCVVLSAHYECAHYEWYPHLVQPHVTWCQYYESPNS
jgi:hypothetical protein